MHCSSTFRLIGTVCMKPEDKCVCVTYTFNAQKDRIIVRFRRSIISSVVMTMNDNRHNVVGVFMTVDYIDSCRNCMTASGR